MDAKCENGNGKGNKMKNQMKKFAFLAHRVENWNWLLNFKLAKDLHKNPEHSWRWVILSPIYYLMSLIYMFGKRGHDRVDKFRFNGSLKGETWLLRNMGWHFFVKSYQKVLRKRILDAVLDLQDRGVEYIGLGALVKAEWLTQGGKWIVDEVGDELTSKIIHGDTLTAAVVVKQIFQQRKRLKTTTPVFITGATSKIGRAVSLILAHKGVPVKMFTESEKRFLSIKREAGKYGKFIFHAKTLKEGSNCLLWVTGKAIPAGGKLLSNIPKNSTVINFSVPNPLSEGNLRERKDVTAIEGGLLKYDPKRTDLSFTMRLKPGLTYACHAGTMVHAKMGWIQHEVGPVDIHAMNGVWKEAVALGFFLPETVKVEEKKFEFSFRKLQEVMASLFF